MVNLNKLVCRLKLDVKIDLYVCFGKGYTVSKPNYYYERV